MFSRDTFLFFGCWQLVVIVTRGRREDSRERGREREDNRERKKDCVSYTQTPDVTLQEQNHLPLYLQPTRCHDSAQWLIPLSSAYHSLLIPWPVAGASIQFKALPSVWVNTPEQQLISSLVLWHIHFIEITQDVLNTCILLLTDWLPVFSYLFLPFLSSSLLIAVFIILWYIVEPKYLLYIMTNRVKTHEYESLSSVKF